MSCTCMVPPELRLATVEDTLWSGLNNMVAVFFAALECRVFMGKPELT